MGKSEFGKGMTYCLGLYIHHAVGYYMSKDKMKKIPKLTYWTPEKNFFEGAKDHLYELYIPELPLELRTKLHFFRDFVFEMSNNVDQIREPTEKDVEWSIDEALNILRIIDKEMKIESIKGDFK